MLGLQFNPATCQARGSATPPAARFLAPNPPVSTTSGTRMQFKLKSDSIFTLMGMNIRRGKIPKTSNWKSTI